MSRLNGTRKVQKPLSVLLGPPDNGEAVRSTTDEFLDRHQRRRYVMDFYEAKEYLMKYSGSMEQRVLEAMKLTAWANCCDYPADEKGRPLSQSDIAALTGSTTQRVSETYKTLEAKYLIRLIGRIPFLIDDPNLECIEAEKRRNGESIPGRGGKPFGFPSPSEEIAKALNYLQDNDPDWFTQYQKIDDKFQEAAEERKQWRQDALDRFRASQPNDAEGDEAEEETSRPGREAEEHENSPDGAENPSDPVGNEPDASLYGFKAFKKLASYKEGTPEKAVSDAIERSGLPENLPGNRDRAVRAAAGRIASLAPEQLNEVLPHFEADLAQIARRRENKPKNWGIVVTVMEDAIKAVQLQRPTPRGADTSHAEPATEPSEEQRRQWEATLADPNATEMEKELAKICLGHESAGRKPAASELGAKTRKAGQA